MLVLLDYLQLITDLLLFLGSFFLCLQLCMLETPLFDLLYLLLCFTFFLLFQFVLLGIPLSLLTVVLVQVLLVIAFSLKELLLLLDELLSDSLLPLLLNLFGLLVAVEFFEDGKLVESGPLIDFRF